ncbi:hypothetical protein ALQ32_100940 [Pseudomonas syringae pv. tagetis]|uniref:Uncharacterized protein n=1 Tax=Pseudomonas syringae pv. tagetis TaxID=129140 RepID=A0A3M3Z6D1_9PSED|nr:hypothetical protein [Pseudomonas syringae group genomosp. 7]RMO90280.1 hypothetical protein ALQ32_100940 [Pseudomonas syringae pv. tagetis]
MENPKIFDFQSFRAANTKHTVTGFDYVHAIYHTQHLPSDFALWMARLYWPEFKVVDECVFIVDNFDESYYQSLLKTPNSKEKNQFWMNLLEITGLFGNLTTQEAADVANALAASWNAKLASELGSSFAQARALVDDEAGEVFVTIGFSE